MTVGSAPTLSDRVMGGMSWQLFGTAAKTVTQFGLLAILARLIPPADFGVVTGILIVVSFPIVLAQLAIGTAIIQHQGLARDQLRTMFWLSLAVGAFGSMGIWFAAPWMAGFLEIPRFLGAARAISPLAFVASMAVVSEALLQKELSFKALSWVEVISGIVGQGAVGVSLAIAGFGYWSLVIALAVQQSVRTLILVFWRPPAFSPLQRFASPLSTMAFGFGQTVAGIANYVALQVDNIVVGRWLGPADLGVYSRAYQLFVAPTSLVGQVVDKVMFPTAASLQDDSTRASKALLRIHAIGALISLPGSILMVVLAPEIVHVLLGPNWSSVVLPFAILSSCLMFRLGYKFSTAIAKAKGLVFARAMHEIVYAALVAAGAVFGVKWGLGGVAIGVSIAVFYNYASLTRLAVVSVGVSLAAFLYEMLPSIRLACFTVAWALPLTVILRNYTSPPLATLAIVGFAGAAFLMTLTRSRWNEVFLGSHGIWFVGQLRRFSSQRSVRPASRRV